MSASRARSMLVVLLLVSPLASASTSWATPESAPGNPWTETPTTRQLLTRAMQLRDVTIERRALMGKSRPVVALRESFPSLLAERRRLLHRWHAKATRARKHWHHPPHKAQWLCIHRYEGHWQDPNAPYYGGLQMDVTFQRTYGSRLLRRKGTADRWTPLEQMWVAERALRSGRGFYPWPVSGSRCGLI